MANSDASSSTTCTVRVLVSFYLAPVGQRAWHSRQTAPGSSEQHQTCSRDSSLNMYRKELPVGDLVTEEPSSADDIGDLLSEYDSYSSNEEDSATQEEDAVEAVPVNFLSKTVRTRTGRQITLSYRALSSY